MGLGPGIALWCFTLSSILKIEWQVSYRKNNVTRNLHMVQTTLDIIWARRVHGGGSVRGLASLLDVVVGSVVNYLCGI